MKPSLLALAFATVALPSQAAEPVTIAPSLLTAPLYNYDDAPATPDVDDPAIWVNRLNPKQTLVIATAKEAGLLAYDMKGKLLQAILPPNAPTVSAQDPATPAGLNNAPAKACQGSEKGDTFGRFNNVDIAYGVRLGSGPNAPRADVAVVSDRGCDRLRFYKIDPGAPKGPLIDITASDAPRVFTTRYDQPSVSQPGGNSEGWVANPLDDQNTAYGLTVTSTAQGNDIFVSQRERAVVRQLSIQPTAQGKLSYTVKRSFVFDTNFTLIRADGSQYDWSPCRESLEEAPQSEGLVFDAANRKLYVAFETIGLFSIDMSQALPAEVRVGKAQLIEPVTSFGAPYWATPDDDEYECEYNPSGSPAQHTLVIQGSQEHAGTHLQADLEGLAIINSLPGYNFLLASSQGDDSFHLFGIGRKIEHIGAFGLQQVGATDGIHYLPMPLPGYPLGLMVAQNGKAPEPDNTAPVNGYDYDGASQLVYVNFIKVLNALLGH